jgi:type I restriction enzyme S subunit
MADVSDRGVWIGHQERRLQEVESGYTPFQENDVLFAKITPCTENGKGAHATRLINGIGFGSTEFHVLRAKNQDSARFLFHWSQSEPLRVRAASVMTGSAGQQRVPAHFFDEFQVPLLPLPEQRRIAEILDAADEAVHQTERVIAKLKALKAGLLHDLLTRGLDEHGRLRDPQAHSEQFRDSLLGRIPREWDVRPLVGLADVDRGKFAHRPRNTPVFYGGQHPFIQTGDVTSADGGVLESYSQTLNERGAAISREFPAGTIAVTIAANIADTAILGIPMYFPDSIVGIVVRPPHDTRYVELCIRTAKWRLDAQAPQSAQKNINLEILRPLLVAVPAPQEQKRIAAAYGAHEARIRAEEATLAKLRQVKRGLMDDLLTGRVRVTM